MSDRANSAAMIADAEAKCAKIAPGDWQVDPDVREGGADQIIDAEGLTIAFMASAVFDDLEPLDNAEAIVALVNNRHELFRLAKIGMRAEEQLRIATDGLERIERSQPEHTCAESNFHPLNVPCTRLAHTALAAIKAAEDEASQTQEQVG